MAKKKKSMKEWPFLRLALTLASTVLAVLIVGFSALVIISIYNDNYDAAPIYLLWIFIFLGMMSVVVFLKDKTKINFIKCLILIVVDLVLGIIVLFAKNNPILFSITAGLYCVTIVISRVFDLIQKRTLRSFIFNILIIIFATAFGIGLFISSNGEVENNVQSIILVECIFIAIVSFLEAMSIALAQLKVRILVRIIVSTFSLEVLLGLLIMIVCSSLIFMAVEPNITTFPEGLWYCFAVVTTIGFGDYVAVTPVGRVVTVFLGIYGLVVVAVITSIIVNFYNETSGKHDQKELKEIKKEEEGK